MSKNNERAPSYDRRGFLQQAGVGLTSGTVLASTVRVGASVAETRLAQGGESQGSIILGQQAGPFYRWMAEELQRYLRLLSGADFPITTAGSTATGTRILLGGPESNELVARAQGQGLVDFSNLKQDGFLLYTIELDGQPALVVAGNDEASTMYAAYDLLERLGIVFQITGDIIPEHKPNLSLPAQQIRMEPALKYRGLHMRHFVMPWMDMDYFQKFLDQLAKLKCNYLEFYWYVGAPWIEYSYGGESKLIGDLYTKESGYLTWRLTAATFKASDVEIGREHFTEERVCATEFQGVETPQEAYRTARQLLTQVIDYAHERKIQVRLGMGDCPGAPPNLGRFAEYGETHVIFGSVIPPGDPAGLEIWEAAARSMIETYPEADGYWIWLAESYFHSEDRASREVVRRYDRYRRLIPRLNEIRELGYDQYFRGMAEEKQIESDLGLLHYGNEIVERIRRDHPSVRFGISLLGRSYLFRAMDAMFSKDIAFQSMEASICWNRTSRVPMHLFEGMGERDTFLVPRLDDDESEFGMQFNVGLYYHDRVLEGSVQNGVAGVAPQTGKLRGLEQNAKFITSGAWKPSLTPEDFYRQYVPRIFGSKASTSALKAYQILEENEMFLGLQAEFGDSHFFLGLGNFLNYGDTRDIRMMGRLVKQNNPFEGPDLPRWGLKKEDSPWIEECRYRRQRFARGVQNLERALVHLRQARESVSAGAQSELEYVMFKTANYTSHLQTIHALLGGFIAYDGAFRAQKRGDEKTMQNQFSECEFLFSQARYLARKTARQLANSKFVEDPTEEYILFRYNVRFVRPLEEFSKFIRNMANFHHGQPYWEEVNREVIAPRQWMNP